ncbi:MAG: sodium:proton exchanger [Actinobacteria bacterium]|nr:sodium:proton exchanger [Actinomycetota bacterium]
MAILLAAACCVPAVFLRLTHPHLPHVAEAILFGLGIVGAAFLLSWAAEVAQLDISAGLAIAVLAFIAVLPEYAVDFVFAQKGGHAFAAFGRTCAAPRSPDEAPCSLALANMTGANRLLIGVGWSLVVFIAWYRWRRRGQRFTGVTLERSHSVEIAFLAVATLYSLTLPFKRSITLVDAGVLVAIFVAYTIRISRAPAEEPHLVGPAHWMGTFAPGRRRATVVFLFVAAATVILLSAEPFAEALVATGRTLGISEFLLVQWLAPLASEAPELLVAGLYAWRLNTNAGLGTLVSSKVNQWTLLVGTLPIAFAVASSSTHGLPIIAQQREELLLTASQSVLALAILANRSVSVREAWMLFSLFWAQFIVGAVVPPSAHGTERVIVSIAYLTLAAGIFFHDRKPFLRLMREGLFVPYAELVAEPVPDTPLSH